MYQLTFPVKKEDINRLSTEIRTEIKHRMDELDLLREMLKLVVRGCDHPGTTTGYNDRDGCWRSQCPICGSSE